MYNEYTSCYQSRLLWNTLIKQGIFLSLLCLTVMPMGMKTHRKKIKMSWRYFYWRLLDPKRIFLFNLIKKVWIHKCLLNWNLYFAELAFSFATYASDLGLGWRLIQMCPKRDSWVIAYAKKTLSVSNIKSDGRENLQLRKVKYILSLFGVVKAGEGVTLGVYLFVLLWEWSFWNN